MRAELNRMFTRLVYRPRWWAAIVLFWAVFSALSYGWQYSRLEADALNMATLRGRLVFSMVHITRVWNASHGGVYAVVTPESPANPYLEHPDKSGRSGLGKPLTLLNPAYMTRQINDLLGDRTDLKMHLTSLNPINPANRPDAWEREALERFSNGAKEQTAFQGSGSEATFRYMAPLYVEKPCLSCHAKQGYRLGDVRGGLSVTQPVSYITGLVDSQKTSLLLIHVAVFVLLALVSLLSLWQNRKQFLNLERAHDERKQAAEALAEKIAELETTRDQLLQSEKMASIGQLAAGVAHEINNPVGFVYSNLGSLHTYFAELGRVLDAYRQSEDGMAPEARTAIAQVKQQAELGYLLEDIPQLLKESSDGLERVKHIIQNLKDFSHVDEGKWQMADLEKGMDGVVEIAWNEIKYKAKIVREYGGIPEVECMPSQINQVFLNLLVNAAQAIPDKGVITLRSGVQGEEVWLEVADSGSGIAPEHLKQIFDPFFTTKPVGKGTGLGLSVSYGIVQKHGGRIEVTSEPGQGTTMRVWLPVKHHDQGF